MSQYDYTVERNGKTVTYEILRNGSVIYTHEVCPISDIGVFQYFSCQLYSETSTGYCLKAAHKLAKKAIENMSKYEKEIK